MGQEKLTYYYHQFIKEVHFQGNIPNEVERTNMKIKAVISYRVNVKNHLHGPFFLLFHRRMVSISLWTDIWTQYKLAWHFFDPCLFTFSEPSLTLPLDSWLKSCQIIKIFLNVICLPFIIFGLALPLTGIVFPYLLDLTTNNVYQGRNEMSVTLWCYPWPLWDELEVFSDVLCAFFYIVFITFLSIFVFITWN